MSATGFFGSVTNGFVGQIGTPVGAGSSVGPFNLGSNIRRTSPPYLAQGFSVNRYQIVSTAMLQSRIEVGNAETPDSNDDAGRPMAFYLVMRRAPDDTGILLPGFIRVTITGPAFGGGSRSQSWRQNILNGQRNVVFTQSLTRFGRGTLNLDVSYECGTAVNFNEISIFRMPTP